MSQSTFHRSQSGDDPRWEAVDNYLTESLIQHDDALIAAQNSASKTTLPHAAIAPNQGALLGLLVSISGAQRILEFGTLAGYSTIWLARAAGPAGQIVTLELSETNAAVARENFKRADVSERIELLLGPAVESAQQLIDSNSQPFDCVFIDADKANNPVYLKAALRLTGPGALIIVDNVVRDGAVLDAETEDPDIRGVREVIAAASEDPSVEATAIQTVGVKGWDGLLILRRS